MKRSAACWLVMAIAAGASPLAAQSQSAALPARLGADTRTAIERLMDSARVTGIPAAALADKAAEGVLKGADDQRILAAVRTLARELGDARAIIAPSRDGALLTAAASALHAGAAPADLRRLAHPAGSDALDEHTIATAFVTLVDLVAKHIPPVSATTAVEALLKRRAPDNQFIVLRSEVEQDIRQGIAPETALTARVRSHVELLDELPLGGRVTKRPPASPW